MEAKGRASLRRMEKSSRNPEAENLRLLKKIIRKNRNTEYGRLHGFSNIKSPEDFKKNVPVFFGMIFTTRMTRSPVRRLLPAFQRLAVSGGRDLELMFHPGGLSENELLWDERFREFHRSPNRYREARTLCSMSPEKKEVIEHHEQSS